MTARCRPRSNRCWPPMPATDRSSNSRSIAPCADACSMRSRASSTTRPPRSRRASASERTRSPDCSAPAAWACVYRARDTTLGRDVALKILPDLWLADPDRRARFDREARLLASLNHPNIGSIYGVHEGEPSPGSGLAVKALVLELVEGETLADRIALHAERSASRRGLPIDEVVSTREPGDRGARSGARARHRAPGPQAGQHQDHARGPREGARLRPRQGDGRRSAAAPRLRIHRR